jgi:hypothetical protein
MKIKQKISSKQKSDVKKKKGTGNTRKYIKHLCASARFLGLRTCEECTRLLEALAGKEKKCIGKAHNCHVTFTPQCDRRFLCRPCFEHNKYVSDYESHVLRGLQ